MSQSPRIDAARAAIARADALVAQAASAWLPSLNANISYTRLDADRFSGRLIIPRDTAAANLALTVPLVSAQRWVETGQARDATQIARTDAIEVQRALLSATGRAYFSVLLQQWVLEVAVRAEKASQAQLQLSKKRRYGGLGSRLELARAERELRDNQGRVARAHADLATAQEALGVITAAGAPLDAGGRPELGVTPQLRESLAAVESRSDLVALKEREKLARRRLQEGWLEYFPVLTATAQPIFSYPPTVTSPKESWQAQLLLTGPLYDGGLRSGRQRERLALLKQAEAALEEGRLRAQGEVRIATQQVRFLEQASAHAEASSELAAEALSLARLAYQEGAATNIELIDAERGARDASTAYSVARNAADIARLDLFVATGIPPRLVARSLAPSGVTAPLK